MSKVRLQKHIADCGVASRRKAEKLILSGKVKVNGKVVNELGTKIDPSVDKVSVEGKLLKQPPQKIYIKLNKPQGYVSSCRKHQGENTIIDLIKDIPYRLYPVGRLDKDSEGLMILTNDGELANRLMHPRYEHEKEYEINLKFQISNLKLKELEQGVIIDKKKTLPAKVDRLGAKKFRIILCEGKKRQIKRMVEAVGNRVIRLKRVRIKNIRLGDLLTGRYAYLTDSEIQGIVSVGRYR
jgi:23S rRNA pseudouridine2605 synthase/23S rRNA pseudouridine2604 synthase